MSQDERNARPDWKSLEGPFTAKDIRSFRDQGRIDKLSLTNQKLVTAEIAKGFRDLQSVRWMWMWCSVTRTAMREVIAISGLETLDVFEIRHPGALRDFASAKNLKTFRVMIYMSEPDLFEVSTLPALEELSAQNAAISHRSLGAILEMPNLKDLDLESTAFDDEMAAAVAKNRQLTKLDIGATKLTRKGLEHICGMPQLRSLDIWANDILEEDLDMLSNLPNLEYLAIGGHDEQTVLTSEGVLPLLEKLPSLKRLWLDGIVLSEQEKAILEQRYEKVRN